MPPYSTYISHYILCLLYHCTINASGMARRQAQAAQGRVNGKKKKDWTTRGKIPRRRGFLGGVDPVDSATTCSGIDDRQKIGSCVLAIACSPSHLQVVAIINTGTVGTMLCVCQFKY